MLSLLPISSLDLSLAVLVMVGVWVLFYLSEAYGFVFSGLIVPGYLGSVFAVSPTSGFTILAEALVALAVVRVLSEGLGRLGAWSPFFGRERFLFVVLTSVLVRQGAETWMIPDLLHHLELWTGRPMPLEEAHSVGLVLVPLTANSLWKLDWKGGLLQVGLPVGIAYGLLNLLLATTNLSLGSVALAYENPALDFLSSPKAYIILLATAGLASRFNLRFGWNAGGILIPALLGLAWLEPWRLLATAGETVVLVGAFRLFALLPVVRQWNLEGGRKLALLFSFAVLLRTALAWGRTWGLPIPVEALGGMGYLLSSLMAVKILQFQSFGLVLLPAYATAALGATLGGAAVWGLETLVPPAPPVADPAGTPPSLRLLADASGAVEWARVRVRLDPTRPPAAERAAPDRAAWRALWTRLDGALASGAALAEIPFPPGMALRNLPALGGRDTWLLAEANERPELLVGWGAALLRPGAPGPVLLLATPWSDGEAAATAADQCAAVDCRALLVSGAEYAGAPGTEWSDALAEITAPTRPVTPLTLPLPEIETLQSSLSETLGALLGAEAPWTPSPAERSFLTEVLVPELAAGAPTALLARHAGELGYALVRWRDGLALLPQTGGPVVLMRTGKAATVLVEVPHAAHEVGTLGASLGLFEGLNAAALVVEPAESDGASLLAFHLGLRRLIAGQPDALALTVRGFGAETAEALPEGVVAGLGVPADGGPPAVARLFEPGGPLQRWPVRWAADRAGEAGLTGSQIPTVQADRLLGGLVPAVLWFSPDARGSWRVIAQDRLVPWLAGAGLTLDSAATDADLNGAAREAPPALLAAAEALGAQMEAARAQTSVNQLRALGEAVADRRGASLRAGWDSRRGWGYLELRLEEGGHRVIRRMPLVSGAALPAVSDSRALDLGPALLQVTR